MKTRITVIALILSAIIGWHVSSFATGTYISGATSNQITVIMVGTADGDPCFSLDTTLNLYYWEEGEASVVGPTNMTQGTLGTYASNTAVEIFDGVSGAYVIYPPDAAFDGGANKKVFFFVTSDTSNVRPAWLEIQLDTTRLIATDNIGVNWGDVTNPTSTVGLTNTTVGTVTTVDTTTTNTDKPQGRYQF